MRRRALPQPTREPAPPLPRVRVLIEDAELAAAACDGGEAAWCDIVVCSGPTTVHDACPLVLDGRCPVGPADVVVCAIQGEWSHSVHAAWREAGTTVVDARALAAGTPDERLRHHLGAAFSARMNLSGADD